jgi:outer membrane lipoprotein SlyB
VFKGITLVVLLVVIAACSTGDVGTKTAIGGLGGAALGGLIAGAAGVGVRLSPRA